MTTAGRNVLRVAGMACLVALGGGRSYAQPGAQEKAEPNVELRRYPLPHAQETLRREVRESAGRIDGLEKEVKALTTELHSLRTELHALRPAVVPEAIPVEPEAVRPVGGPDPEDGKKGNPYSFRFFHRGAGVSLLMVVSPGGGKVVFTDPGRTFPKSVKLSDDNGPRHQVRPVFEGSLALVPLAIEGPRITRLAVLSCETPETAPSPALPFPTEPIPAPLVIAPPSSPGLSSRSYAWYPIDLREPVDSAAPEVDGTDSVRYTLGRRIYAFSRLARRWDVLELPARADPVHSQSNEGPTVENDGHIYTFVLATGKWNDIDLRAILGTP